MINAQRIVFIMDDGRCLGPRFRGGGDFDVITFCCDTMAPPDWMATLIAFASLLCFLCLCVRYRRSGLVFWRKLLSKIMARTEKPLFRIA